MCFTIVYTMRTIMPLQSIITGVCWIIAVLILQSTVRNNSEERSRKGILK
jgi:hypothetical protein